MVEKGQKTLAKGGVVFVFPEGTRSATGEPGVFKKGAFFFAKALEAPLEIFQLIGTNILFPPGRVLFNTRPGTLVERKRLGRIDPTAEPNRLSAKKIRDRVYAAYQNAAAGPDPDR